MSLRRVVFQMFDFKKCRDLQITGQNSLKLVPFDRLYMVYYYPTVTLSVRCTVF